MVGCRAQAIDVVAEIDAGQIAGEYLLLAEPRLKPDGDQRLAELAGRGLVGAEESQLGALLGDGAAALDDPSRPGVALGSTEDAPGIDAAVVFEAERTSVV